MSSQFADSDVIGLMLQALVLCAKLAGPPLVAALVVGMGTSLFQAVFQVQDQSLPTILKMAAAAVALVVAGPWMLHTLVDFTTTLYTSIPHLLGQ